MKRPSYLLTVPLFVLAISFFACDNDSEDSSYDLYVYGVQNQKGTVWKNGKERPEPMNSNYLMGSFVDGKDFYVTGIGQGGVPVKSVAKYWKNTTEVALSNGTYEEWAYDVALAGSDVYVVGYDNGVGGSSLRAKYWKNGNEVILGINNQVNASIATNVLVSGSDVYMLAWENVNHNDSIVARLWRNGKRMQLEHDSVYYYVETMFLYGGDLHLIGYESNKLGFRVGAYWKNGAKAALNLTQGGFHPLVKGSDFYSITMNGTGTGVSKNGVYTQLTDQSVEIVSLDVYGNDVIVAGNLLHNGGARSGIVWKNGVPVAPFLGTDQTINLKGAVGVQL